MRIIHQLVHSTSYKLDVITRDWDGTNWTVAAFCVIAFVCFTFNSGGDRL